MATAIEIEPVQPVVAVERRSIVSMLRRNRKFLWGSVVFFGILLAALIGAQFVDAAMRRTGAFPPKMAPTFDPPGLWMGSTTLGQGVAIQWTQAVPNSILIGLIAATIGTTVGAVIGLAGGYFGGRVDAVLRIVVDVFLSVPSLLFLILIASLLKGVSVVEMALIIGAFAWAWPARAVRSQTLSLKERPFVRVAKLSGMGDPEIILRELLPQLLPWLGANFLNAFIAAILAESALSIIGLGPATEITLGIMIYWALNFGAMIQNLWWWWLTPVITLMALFLSLYIIHLGLDEVANPRLRQQS
ncbi:MAG TPA: ABC transporter permease [Thermomicrobiales bacterium]|nr:ABC transporter permease [Thermomicrobiales bacterium]